MFTDTKSLENVICVVNPEIRSSKNEQKKQEFNLTN